ncbi:MAG: hypothetical protein HY823_08925 [Acidobacteria bacterium]|nr:hypothetical protein [Acidobacteriota bacterium]
MSWPLPPDIEWARFLRLLRQPAPPRGWLEAAAQLPELRKRPLLLRWIAQHPRCPAHLRANLLPRLPALPLAAIANDAGAHPQARQMAGERLQTIWQGLSSGERRSLALRLPRKLWPQAWRVPDSRVIHNLLRNPRMNLDALLVLLQPPLTRAQDEALLNSSFAGMPPVIAQVLQAMDRTFLLPEASLVLGQAAPWIKALDPEQRLVEAARLTHPPLRRMCRAWARVDP